MGVHGNARAATRECAIAAATAWFDSGAFEALLARRVACRTESQGPDAGDALRAYLEQEIGPAVAELGFAWRVVANPVPGGGPFLLAERREGADLPTVLTYGHGDVVWGYDGQWRDGRSPWTLARAGDRWFGRGSADNKGQHTINLAALARVLDARGRLGFNMRLLVETGEETGSPGLADVCAQERAALAADVLIASDGPRLAAAQPTLFLGSRGAFNFDLTVALRDGAHHSGNWGGLLANPATILANAIASLVDARGRILVPGLQTPPIPASVRAALADVAPGEPGGPSIDVDWGEPDLSPALRVFAANALEVLAFGAGNVARPVNAIPPRATAHLQLRYVVGTDDRRFVPALRAHLDAHGFERVDVAAASAPPMRATRLDPAHPWVRRIARSVEATTGRPPVILPSLGGSLPNDCFAEIVGMPTVWVPHSYPGCAQHAPDEHLLVATAREGLAIMTGIFWDLGEPARD
ncbi:MAG: M20 family metallopeptidase [Burkholderiales bacterium]